MEGIPALLLWDQILEALTDQVEVSKPSDPRNSSPDPLEGHSGDSADLFRSELFKEYTKSPPRIRSHMEE